MDGTVLIDAVILALTDPCKEVCQTSLLALKLIRETAVALIGNIDKVMFTLTEVRSGRAVRVRGLTILCSKIIVNQCICGSSLGFI